MSSKYKTLGSRGDCPTILYIPPRVAIHAPGGLLKDVNAQLKDVPPLNCAVQALESLAAAGTAALSVIAQAFALRLKGLLLQAARSLICML